MTARQVVYFDNNATTPLDEQVLDAMMPYLTDVYGNAASSSHVFGWAARDAVETAREQVAAFIGAAPQEIIFTSGATEADNLALKGLVATNGPRRIVTCSTEHKAILDTARSLIDKNVDVEVLEVDEVGRINAAELAHALGTASTLLSLMTANNEIGTVHPIAEYSELAHQNGALIHTDAAQAALSEVVDVRVTGVDMLSLSAHKMYGPKGIGALYVRRPVQARLLPEMLGGGHERGLRSGTLNVPAIVGFGRAAEMAAANRDDDRGRVQRLRDRFEARLIEAVAGVTLNGDRQHRLPGLSSVSFGGVDATTLLNRLRTVVAASTGSACTSATPQPSHVLTAIGLDLETAESTVRFGIGRKSTEAEVDYVSRAVEDQVRFLRTATHQVEAL